MSRIKRAAADALVAFLGGTEEGGYTDAAVSALQQKVYPYERDIDVSEQTPYLAIVAGNFKLVARQAQDIGAATAQGLQLTQVGRFEGRVQLKLWCQSQPEREDLEDLVINAFLSRDGSPGIAVLTTDPVDVGTELQVQPAQVAYELTDTTWQGERVFDKRRGSTLNVNLIYPAAVMRAGVYTLQHLYLRLSEDLGNTAGAAPFEQREIHADGTTTPAQGA